MKLKRISWYQAGMISLLGIGVLGMFLLSKEIERHDLRVIQINLPENTRSKLHSIAFNLTAIDELKKKTQILIPIDSLPKIEEQLTRILKAKSEKNVMTVFWQDTTRLQKIVSVLSLLQKKKQKRYALVNSEKRLYIAFDFPKEEDYVFVCGTSLLTYSYTPDPKPTYLSTLKTQIFTKDFFWLWVMFVVLCLSTGVKIWRN